MWKELILCITLTAISLMIFIYFFNWNDESYPTRRKILTKGCSAYPPGSEFPNPEPLFLRPEVTYSNPKDYKSAFYVPDRKTALLSFFENEVIHLACPGTVLEATETEDEVVICKHERYKLSSGDFLTLDELKCSSYVKSITKKGGSCMNSSSKIFFGFEVDEIFLPIFYVCHDESLCYTHYAWQRVPAELWGHQLSNRHPNIHQGHYFENLSMNSLYTIEYQTDMFRQLLGSRALAKKFVNEEEDRFLVPGHLADRWNFMFRSHNRASFHYLNMAPQWHKINTRVWKFLETSIRRYAVDRGKDLEVYTGTYGTLKLNDTHGTSVKIYLAQPRTCKETINVPKYFWKVVMESNSNRGVAFMTINNPYLTKTEFDEYILCENVVHKLKWVGVEDCQGLLFACPVNEFNKISKKLPTFNKCKELLTYLCSNFIYCF